MCLCGDGPRLLSGRIVNVLVNAFFQPQQLSQEILGSETEMRLQIGLKRLKTWATRTVSDCVHMSQMPQRENCDFLHF